MLIGPNNIGSIGYSLNLRGRPLPGEALKEAIHGVHWPREGALGKSGKLKWGQGTGWREVQLREAQGRY